ncbi:hypothetical protein ACMYUJ_15550 [Stutzerimonas zhaodongensis]|uniref:hypothetical protein n=1 Tax=Stutzerimonas zhaodongensis TaxID=1176257 RepID=UPI0039F0544C
MRKWPSEVRIVHGEAKAKQVLSWGLQPAMSKRVNRRSLRLLNGLAKLADA